MNKLLLSLALAASSFAELYWVKSAGHVDLYDRTDLIPFDKLTAFFEQHLAVN